MSNALAKIDFSQEELAVIKKQFFPAGGSPAEQQYCFAVAKELGLNPITREVFFVPRRQKVNGQWQEKIEPMVGRDGFLSIAHRSSQLAGMETTAGIREVPRLVGGKWQYQQDLMAECTVWRKDSEKPFTVQVAYAEYVQKNNDGNPTKFWAEKPETMLKKVAESQCLRKAFNIHGVYSPEEMGAGYETDGGEIVITPTIDAEYTRTEPEKGHLSVVAPPQTTAPETTTFPFDDEVSWPVGPPPDQNPAPGPLSSDDGVLGEIISLLEAKGIEYELDTECGIISAKSYAHKELLKQNGFRWSPDIKAWTFNYDKDPF